MKKNRHQKQENLHEQVEENTEEVLEQNDSKVQLLEEENQKLKDELLRALAESENVKKRCAAEVEKNNKYAIAGFAKDLLGVADNLDRALSAIGGAENADCQALLAGVELTKKELTHVFEKFGITKMDVLDKPFDPNFHQVIQQVSDPSKPSGTVVAELQTGYMLNGRILREAMVVVAKE